MGDACWPGQLAWERLARDLGPGVLKEVADAKTVYRACAGHLGSGIGAVQLNLIANGTCSFGAVCAFESCNTTGSEMSNLPVYSVAATTVDHVQKAVAFANQHEIRVSVKSTGASYSIANSQPDSILIWMSNFVKYSAAGVSETFSDTCGHQKGPVLKVGGGEQWGDVFTSLVATGDYELSSGAAVTVGGAGGWLQGGGLGPMDRELGLGIDNVVEFEVVVPDGTVKKADACSESDLFWALRGGGGGNWGVVLSATYKAYKRKPLTKVGLYWKGAESFGPFIQLATGNPLANIPVGYPLPFPNKLAAGEPSFSVSRTAMMGNSSHPSISKWWEVMLGLMNPVTADRRIDGYYSVGCRLDKVGGLAAVCADIWFRGNLSEWDEAFGKPLREAFQMTAAPDLMSADGPEFLYMAGSASSFYATAARSCGMDQAGAYICNASMGGPGWAATDGYNADVQVGTGLSYGPTGAAVWLLPKTLFTTEKDRMRQLLRHPLSWYAGVNHIVGGAVMDVADDATAINPAIRNAALHWFFIPAFEGGQVSMPNARALIQQHMPPPHGAPCFNHDSKNSAFLDALAETNGMTWEDLYWGSNLPRLRSIKGQIDPKGIFTCSDCLTAQPKSKQMSMQTCGDVQAAYKAAGCCGNPSKTFTTGDMKRRRLSEDEQLVESVETALQKQKAQSGSSSSLAKAIGDIVKDYIKKPV